jgi:methyl-accepting chemotaxis protein/methyl-accepting chemotaxis protein-1 (serine sensor receptor)
LVLLLECFEVAVEFPLGDVQAEVVTLRALRLDEVAVAIRSITESSNQVKTLVDEVNMGSEEQARGIEQVAKAVAQMEQVTQKTAASAEESASAGEELSAQSEILRHVVERLTVMVGGGSETVGRSRAARPRAAAPRVARRGAAPSAGLAALGKAVGTGHAPRREKLDRDAIPLEDHLNSF